MNVKLVSAVAVLTVAIILLIVGLSDEGENTVPDNGRSGVATETSSARSSAEIYDFLAPHVIAMKPAGEGPFPTIALFPGCAGTKRMHYIWAQKLRAIGYGTVLVDGFAARGIYADRSIPAAGRCVKLPVSERTGDVVASLQLIRDIDWVDDSDLTVMGWSHGGATILATLAGISSEAGLSSMSDRPEDPLAGLQTIVLFYPPCGLAGEAANLDWTPKVPTLFLLAAEDQTVSAEACVTLADEMRDHGHIVTVHSFEGADHGFDDRKWDGRWNADSAAEAEEVLLGYMLSRQAM